jgi:hypothetical protein
LRFLSLGTYQNHVHFALTCPCSPLRLKRVPCWSQWNRPPTQHRIALWRRISQFTNIRETGSL